MMYDTRSHSSTTCDTAIYKSQVRDVPRRSPCLAQMQAELNWLASLRLTVDSGESISISIQAMQHLQSFGD